MNFRLGDNLKYDRFDKIHELIVVYVIKQGSVHLVAVKAASDDGYDGDTLPPTLEWYEAARLERFLVNHEPKILSDKNKVRVFVYGTLKSDKYNHDMLGYCKQFIDKDTVKGKVYRQYQLPMLFKGLGQVAGEVYDIHKTDYERIWSMERNAGYEQVDTHTFKGHEVKVFYMGKDHEKKGLTRILTY